MAFEKIKFFYKTGLVNMTASVTDGDSRYSASNLLDMREWKKWKGVGTSDTFQYPSSGPGAGANLTADYDIFSGHNLGSVGATVVLQYSATGAWAGEEVNAYTPFDPSDDKTKLKEFNSVTSPYWRRKLSGMSAAPIVAISKWGEKVIFDHASVLNDPNRQKWHGVVNRSLDGTVIASYKDWVERILELKFSNRDSALYTKLDAWWEKIATGLFFVAWETGAHGSDVWLVSSQEEYNNPLSMAGAGRNFNLSFRGRKE